MFWREEKSWKVKKKENSPLQNDLFALLFPATPGSCVETATVTLGWWVTWWRPARQGEALGNLEAAPPPPPLCTVAKGRCALALQLEFTHTPASWGSGLCWGSATHSKEESRARLNTSASYQQQEWPRKRCTSSASTAFSSCSLPWTRKETVHKIECLGYMPQAHTTSKNNIASAAGSPQLITALLIISTPYLQGAPPKACFKTLSVQIAFVLR